MTDTDEEKKETPKQLTPLNIKKMVLPGLKIQKPPETTPTDDGYKDALNTPTISLEKKNNSIESDDSITIDPNNIDIDFVDQTMGHLDSDIGNDIDLDNLDEGQIFSDLKDTDETLSILKQHGQKSVYISRVYQPPSILYNIPNSEILEKYKSLYFLSIGTGRNLWMAPELISSHSKTVFDATLKFKKKGEEITDVNDIKTKEQLEGFFQKAFEHIKKYNLLILGTIYLESNSFKDSPLEDCPIGKVTLKRLEQILEDRHNTFELPKLTDANFINMRYYGPNSDIIANSEAQGLMDIADEITKKEIFLYGILSGIVCVNKNSAHFFILGNNFKRLHESNPIFSIDQPTLDMMYQMIRSYELTPISWFRIRLGMNAFDYLDLGKNVPGSWNDNKKQGPLKLIFDEYYKYLHKILKSKADQNAIQNQMEEMEKSREEMMKKFMKE